MRRSLLRLLPCLILLPLLAGTEQQVLEEGSPARLTVLGNNALARGQYETALRKYEEALSADKGYFYALFNLGLTHQRLAETATIPAEVSQHYTLAKQAYEEAHRQQQDNPETLCNLGIIAFRLGQYNQALKPFQSALERGKDPQDIASYAFNLGRTYEALGEWHRARDAYGTCLDKDKNHFGAHYNLGTLYLEHLDNPSLAKEHLQQAHTTDPKRPEPLINLAVLIERQGGEAEGFYSEAARVAEAHYDRLLDLALWHRARFYHRTDSARLGGKPTQRLMVADLERILKRNPEFPGANGLLGAYYESLADYGRAIPHLEKEVEGAHFDPSSEIDLQCHYLLAIIYSDHMRDPSKALHHATEYYRVSEDSAGKALERRARRMFGQTTGAASPAGESPSADAKQQDSAPADPKPPAPADRG